MSNILETFEKKQIDKLKTKKRIPTFRAGDTLKVTVKITEGDKSRLQSFEGMCISKKNNSLNSSFTVRKISHGEGVERVFPLFSPVIEKIEVMRKGDVRRAKLYYLRDRTGKKARIADRDRGDEADLYPGIEENLSEDKKELNISIGSQETLQNSESINDDKNLESSTEEEKKESFEEKIEKNSSSEQVNKVEKKSDGKES